MQWRTQPLRGTKTELQSTAATVGRCTCNSKCFSAEYWARNCANPSKALVHFEHVKQRNWCKGLLSRLYFPNSCFDAASFQRCTSTWTLILRRSFVHSDAALFTGVALLFLFPLYTYVAISEHCFSCKSVVTTLNLALTLWCIHISDLLFSVSSLGADHDIVSWMRSLKLISPALKCVAYVFTHAHA